jgi:hypothetical protein
MSIFRTQTLTCPACSAPVAFELVHSVSADRRPDLREAILDGSFQRQPCPSCGASFRVDPEFTYMDIARGQYIGVWPIAKRGEWQACAERTGEVFDAAMGPGASPAAQKLGAKMEARVVFGFPALVEKLLARQAGIDDRSLEVAKVAAMSTRDAAPVPGSQELRLVGESEGDLILGWVRGSDGKLGDAMRVPRQLVADIEADPDRWKELRDDVADGLVVDFQRAMLAA